MRTVYFRIRIDKMEKCHNLFMLALTTVKATQKKTRNDVMGFAMIKNVTMKTTSIARRIFRYSSVPIACNRKKLKTTCCKLVN